MNRKEIENAIRDIMIEDGPDRHCDGYDIITDFIIAIKEGREYEWISKYREEKDIT